MTETFVEQVGGQHYQAEYQHWDWAADLELGYFEGQASKYICRHRHKLGLEDLRKARSFVEKLIKVRSKFTGQREALYALPHIVELTQRLKEANGLTAREYRCCLNLAAWTSIESLETVLGDVDTMLRTYGQTGAAPRSDSNKHAKDDNADQS